MINDIKEKAATLTIPDHYTQRLTITDPETQQTKQIDRTWDFMVLENKENKTTNRPMFFVYKYTDTVVEEIPDDPSGSGNIPETGDGANLALWMALAAASLTGMAVMQRRKNAA